MSLYDALLIGVSGLDASSRAMSIFSSNIANINTVGYKGSESAFQTMLGAANGGDAGLAAGVMASAQANISQQGAEFQTQSPTDLAITGNGFFCVGTTADQAAQMLYTRAGSFNPDASGNLRNSAGLYLMGYALNPDGTQSSSTLSPINISGLGGKGQASTLMSIAANLDSTADIVSPYVAGQMTDAPSGGSTVTPQFQTTINVYDSHGGVQPLQISFVKTADNTWSYEVDYKGNASNLAPPGTGGNLNNLVNSSDANPIASGTMSFGVDGELEGITPTDGSATNGGTFNLTIPWASSTGLQPQALAFNMGTIGNSDGMTQNASDSVLSSSHVDGAIYGTVIGETIGPDGTVSANYSNGLTQAAFKVPVATFNNPNGLSQVGGNAYMANAESGNPMIDAAGVGGAGSIQAYALEGSTVDLATEFTNMITTQQAYSASARVISTASQMLDELMQMQH